jgi:hypothetical protein
MKKPLFNESERRIIHENNSLLASRMKLHIALNRLVKVIMKSFKKE